MTATKAIDITDSIPFKPNRTRGQFVRAVKAALRKRGIPYVDASLDAAGNCRICGESGRCPGVHTVDELAEAEKRARG
jgi:hypothetical protein